MDAPEFKKVHFIGIGGAGMSGIATVLHERGYIVTGSDLKASRAVRALTRTGVEIIIGHEEGAIDRLSPDIIVTSTAIPQNNPELIRAQELGISVWPRAKMLAELARGAVTIAIAGTHGKTTTSSMAAVTFDRMGLDPTFLIGGQPAGYEANGVNGKGDFFIAEADESDGSFLYLNPNVAVITNIEADHMDHYKTMEALEDTFYKFMNSVPVNGYLVVCNEAKRAVEIAHRCKGSLLTYGFTDDCDVVASQITHDGHGLGSKFDIKLPNGEKVTVRLSSNPGRHNVLNATAVISVAYALGQDVQKAVYALGEFEGVRRRFTRVGEFHDIMVVDDYGHHPTEVAATLEAAHGLSFNNIYVVFQPHRYSRTLEFADAFGSAFVRATKVLVMDVFSAGETPMPGVSGKLVVRAIHEHDAQGKALFVPARHEAAEKVAHMAKPGDLILTMGAGDVTDLAPEILRELTVIEGAEV